MKRTLTCTGTSTNRGKVGTTLRLKGGLCYDIRFIFFSFLYLTRCIITAVSRLTTFTSYLFLFTYDSFWLSTNTPLWLSISTYCSLTHYDSVTIHWLIMSRLLYSDSRWVALLIVLVTHCPSDTIVLVTSIVGVTLLFSITISTGVFGP